jgi:hypothetical protein
MAIGLITALGITGLLGAWYRLLNPYFQMNPVQVKRTRLALFCGVVSSIGLAIWAYDATFLSFSIAFILLGIAGAVLIRGTPRSNAL